LPADPAAPLTARAMVLDGAGLLAIRDVALPTKLSGGGLLEVTAAGICGTDVRMASRPDGQEKILGHEIVGRVAALDQTAAQAWGADVGDRVVVEEYLPCGQCLSCRKGELRYCWRTDARGSNPLRYGTTPLDVNPGLWGAYSTFLYLHPSALIHRIPDNVSDRLASLTLPVANGIQFMQYDARCTSGCRVAILGPGQQGLGCLVAALQAGAEEVLVGGLQRDAARLDQARRLGATAIFDVELASPYEAEFDIVVDMSVGSDESLELALSLARPGAVVVVGAAAKRGGIAANVVLEKHLTLMGLRGHTFAAVHAALNLLSSQRFPLEELCGDSFGLSELPQALEMARNSEVVHPFIEPQR
jgi:threonine dehydrogenase-like Zn-dependent dehydrogenase